MRSLEGGASVKAGRQRILSREECPPGRGKFFAAHPPGLGLDGGGGIPPDQQAVSLTCDRDWSGSVASATERQRAAESPTALAGSPFFSCRAEAAGQAARFANGLRPYGRVLHGLDACL